MADKPVNVDGIRRMLDVSPDEMTDMDLRCALASLAADFNADGTPECVADEARRFADAINRVNFG